MEKYFICPHCKTQKYYTGLKFKSDGTVKVNCDCGKSFNVNPIIRDWVLLDEKTKEPNYFIKVQ